MKDRNLYFIIVVYFIAFMVDISFPLENRAIEIPQWRTYLRYIHLSISISLIPLLLHSLHTHKYTRFVWLVITFYLAYILSVLMNDNKEFAEIFRKLELLQLFLIFIKLLSDKFLSLEFWLNIMWLVLVLGAVYNVSSFNAVKVYGNSNGYLLCYFIPYMAIRRKYLFVLITIISVILCLKRGPILLAILGCIFYSRHMLKYYLILFLASVVYLKYNPKIMNLGLAVLKSRFSDLEGPSDDVGSGRGKAYSIIWNKISEISEIPLTLLGHGYSSAQLLLEKEIGTRLRVHSDILELFYDYGVLFFVFILAFLKQYFKLFGFNIHIIFLLIVILFQSVISFSFTSNFFLFWIFCVLIISRRYESLRHVSTT